MHINKLLHQIRARYELKRRKRTWKKRKEKAVKLIGTAYREQSRRINYPNFNIHTAPKRFSFINNTNEVLSYFNNATSEMKYGKSVYLDIADISELTPDTIVLLLAHLGEKKEGKKAMFGGNAPSNENLKKIFTESGIYEFVKSRGKKDVSVRNRLWKHSKNKKINGQIAYEAIELGKNLINKDRWVDISDLQYNLLTEAMSNTVHHADKVTSSLNWWMYTYLDEKEGVCKYCLVDLGIGIFKSASFVNYRKTLSNFVGGNKSLVKPFLDGKIVSSRKVDHQLSGKGIKQMLSCAKQPEFKKFYIITNDIKIDVKTGNSEVLGTNFSGTCIYYEVGGHYNGNKI